jgi:hypothetical protein
MTDLVTVWDGIEFKQLPTKEAYELQNQDKVQVCDKLISGHEYKYRHEFTGYNTPEPKTKPKVLPKASKT